MVPLQDMETKRLEHHEFPELLTEIPDPPTTLYIRGDYPSQSNTFLSVVGSRKYTEYGKRIVRELISALRGLPVVIVSGLALGMDSLAHKEALDNGLTTLAVPGSGLDDSVLYPRSHLQLAKRILHKGGCLLSEFEPTFKATRWSFPQRNRIMAGLSHAVLVVEASMKSGTLITARLAMEYNRDVLTVPGSIFSTNTEGPHMLIKNGATPITSGEDLIEALGLVKAESSQKELFDNLSDDEQVILDLLREPLSKEELVSQSGFTASKANILLSTMEIKGYVEAKLNKIHIK